MAHVDTGATAMVSNVTGEIHGAIPTTAHCGPAQTGSQATIDALGTWMIKLVGSNQGTDLPHALRSTTQITAFQRRGTDLPEQEHAELWRELEPVLSEIFVSEILTRVWGAILTALDWELSCHDYEPIARNVLIGHLDARRRALILLASDGRVSQEHLARVDQIRRRVERWTDLLLGHLVDHYPVEDFAFEPQRAHDFCSQDLLQSANRPRQQAWNLVLIGLKMAFPEPAEIDPPNELLQHQIVSSMLQCFPPEAFLGDGPFRSLLRDQESDEFSENRFDCAANPDPMSDLELRLPPQATVNLISFRKLRGRLPPPKG